MSQRDLQKTMPAPVGDVPPRTDLPREVRLETSWAINLKMAISVLVLLLLANEVARRYLVENPINRGSWLVWTKWELLRSQQEPVDWLFLGDSACNQGVDPRVWSEEMDGQTALNLCTIGNMTVVGDAWMLGQYLEEVGVPKNVVLVHVWDVWPRDLRPDVLNLIPASYGFWERFEPSVPMSWGDERDFLLHRYAPLYSQHASLRARAFQLVGLEPRSEAFEVTEQGFMPWDKPRAKHVIRSSRGIRKKLSKTRFDMSEVNAEGLARVVELTGVEGINLYVVTSPLHEGVAKLGAFKRYKRAMMQDLGERLENAPHARLIMKLRTYPANQMENPDHLASPEAQTDYTKWLAENLRSAAPLQP